MIVRLKLIVILASSAAVLLALVYAALQATLLAQYTQLEAQAAQASIHRALDTLTLMIEAFSRANKSWAYRDDTYAYLVDPDPSYAAARFTPEQFVTLDLNLMVYARQDGAIAFSTGFDQTTRQFVPPPASLADYLKPGSPLLDLPVGGALSGLLLLPESPLLVVAHAVLPSVSNPESVPAGVLLWGRFLNSDIITTLSDVTDTTLTLRPWQEAAPPTDFAAALRALAEHEERQPVFVQTFSTERLAAYTMLRDITDTPALLMRMVMPRTLYRQGLASLDAFMRLALLCSLVGFGLAWLLLEYFIVGRVAALADDLRAIRAAGDRTARVRLHGRDEVAALASDINNLLTRLHDAQIISHENAQRLRLIATGTPLIIFALNRAGAFTLLAGRVPEVVGAPIESLIHYTIHEPPIVERIPWLTQAYAAGMRGETLTMEVTLNEHVFSLWTTPQRDEADAIVGVFGVATDITALKNAQKAAQPGSRAGRDAQAQSNSDNFNPSGVQS